MRMQCARVRRVGRSHGGAVDVLLSYIRNCALCMHTRSVAMGREVCGHHGDVRERVSGEFFETGEACDAVGVFLCFESSRVASTREVKSYEIVSTRRERHHSKPVGSTQKHGISKRTCAQRSPPPGEALIQEKPCNTTSSTNTAISTRACVSFLSVRLRAAPQRPPIWHKTPQRATPRVNCAHTITPHFFRGPSSPERENGLDFRVCCAMTYVPVPSPSSPSRPGPICCFFRWREVRLSAACTASRRAPGMNE